MTRDQITIQKEQKSTVDISSRDRFWRFLAFLFFVAFISILYLQNRRAWQNELSAQAILIDSLTIQSHIFSDRITELEAVDNAVIQQIRSLEFDSFDPEHYRVYGLYRTSDKSLTRESISQQFNVYNAGAIKYSDVLSERWFTVPVKGVHQLKNGESVGSLATLYYTKVADSVLIQDFNPIIKPGRVLFIPFGN